MTALSAIHTSVYTPALVCRTSAGVPGSPRLEVTRRVFIGVCFAWPRTSFCLGRMGSTLVEHGLRGCGYEKAKEVWRTSPNDLRVMPAGQHFMDGLHGETRLSLWLLQDKRGQAINGRRARSARPEMQQTERFLSECGSAALSSTYVCLCALPLPACARLKCG